MSDKLKQLQKDLQIFDKSWDYTKPHSEYFKAREKISKKIIALENSEKTDNKSSTFQKLLKLFKLK